MPSGLTDPDSIVPPPRASGGQGTDRFRITTGSIRSPQQTHRAMAIPPSIVKTRSSTIIPRHLKHLIGFSSLAMYSRLSVFCACLKRLEEVQPLSLLLNMMPFCRIIARGTTPRKGCFRPKGVFSVEEKRGIDRMR
ncbi:MAG: hypothetical protein MPW16_15700 [Candidatus Manganitrophus sp.]|nr:MAG: hypothetical protein MPW16_15700 [Candidatus Manganitrophus sp.]